jgi:hypothetical protein
LRYGWCGLEEGLLLLMIVDEVVAALGCLPFSS